MENTTITINEKQYTFDRNRLKYGQKKELVKLAMRGMRFEGTKPILDNLEASIDGENESRERLAIICFSLPQDFSFDEIESTKAEEILQIVDDADLLGVKKNQARGLDL